MVAAIDRIKFDLRVREHTLQEATFTHQLDVEARQYLMAMKQINRLIDV